MSSLDILMAAAGNAPSVSYWILTIDSIATTRYAGTMDVDSTGNARIVWNDNVVSPVSSIKTLYAQVNPAGAISFARLISDGGSTTTKYLQRHAIGTDGSGYAFGATNGSTASAYIVKFNSSGVMQSQATWNASGSIPITLLTANCEAGADGNIYTGGTYATNNSQIIKINSSASFVWGIQYGGGTSSTASGIYGVAVNNSTYDVYGVGFTSGTAPTRRAAITKVNSSGTIQWQRQLYGTTNTWFYDTIVNSSGDVYACGTIGLAGILAKYNSSGTLQWVKQIDTGSYVYLYSVSFDSAGNVYVAGMANVTGWVGYGAIIAKYNSSGILQWQRYLTGFPNGVQAYSSSVTVNANKVENAVYLSTGYTSSTTGNSYPLIAKLPQNGSLTGTYGNYTYSVATATDSTPSVTSTTWSPAGSSAFTNNVYTVSNTDAATTVTTTLNNM